MLEKTDDAIKMENPGARETFGLEDTERRQTNTENY